MLHGNTALALQPCRSCESTAHYLDEDGLCSDCHRFHGDRADFIDGCHAAGPTEDGEPHPDVLAARKADHKRKGRVASIAEIEAMCERLAERTRTPEYQALLDVDREWEARLEEANRRRWAERNADSTTEPAAKAEAQAMKAAGQPVGQIADHFGVSKRTMYRWLRA